MISIKEIKHRITSVRDTKKITNAMYLIASTKVRKAKSDLEKTRPYFSAMQKEIGDMFRADENADSVYFYPRGAEGTLRKGACGILVVTADKGLAGAYNQNVLKKAQSLVGTHPGNRLFVVGEYGRQYFTSRGVPFERDFDYTAQNPTLHRAREICDILLDRYTAGELNEIFVVYTDFGGGRSEHVYVTRLLPLSRGEFGASDGKHVQFEYEPSVSVVLDNVIHSYVSGFVYSALVDSYCCEQNARMVAMLGADNNAEEILAELSLEYNRVRQAAITQEITEVTSGAKSMKRKGADQ